MGGARGVVGARRADRVLPRWVAMVIGVGGVLIGILLALQPFRSLAVLVIVLVVALVVSGLVDLSTPLRTGHGWVRLVPGVGQLALGLALLAWPGPGLRVLTTVVSVALVLEGLGDLVEGARAAGTARWGTVGGGVAQIVLGVLALSWPDVAVLVVAIAFGVRLALAGARLAGTGSAGARTRTRLPRTPARWRQRPGRGWQLSRGVTAAVGAVVLAGLSLLVQRSSPQADGFYAWRDPVPAAPGQLLRTEPFERDVPAGGRGWRILYSTTRDEGTPAVASAIVVSPTAAGGRTPVVAWAHGTTGWDTGCAPSVLEHPFEVGALFSLDAVIAEGWTLVATDYVGLGTEGSHPYLIGQGEGRSVLDSIRAAHQIEELRLTDSTVVWGHSQGGHAALWAGMLAPSYAPELEISGVAALAPASNLGALVGVVGSIRVGSLFGAYVVQAYTDAYADVAYADYVRPGAQVIVREMAARCLSERGVLVSVATALLLDQPVWNREPTTRPFANRLAENSPTGPITAPLLIAQGTADTLITPASQQAYVTGRCAAGTDVDYRTYEGRDHVALMHDDSPAVADLLAWTEARFDGVEASGTCR
ncbi:lipase family protein [Intrasporangium sp.]|uniref:lipase family protein n=1 Tax=Intrasporangium sp. TaxID=1925024 RepID=UPI00293B143C|nr:lipase family protein [Intrasporangium sp.]MDV3221009.1 DUF308 domain-containing protein [Intrasporangium sp.]